jgi:hypothetical protein
VRKALATLLHDENLRESILEFILSERKAFRKRKKAPWSEQSFYDDWFRYIIDVREDELQKVLVSGVHGRRKWERHFPTSTPYLTRLPDHGIIAITLRLLDEIGCAPNDPDTLKFRLLRWKDQAVQR